MFNRTLKDARNSDCYKFHKFINEYNNFRKYTIKYIIPATYASYLSKILIIPIDVRKFVF